MKTPKLISLLINTHLGIFLGICFLVDLIISLPFIFLPEGSMINESEMVIEASGGKAAVYFTGIIVAPLFETFIYQFSVIKGIRLLIKSKLWNISLAIPISALLFALSHSYTINYQIATFIVGLLYAVIFYIAQYRRDLPAFLIVAILHGSWNLFAFVMDEIGY